MAERTRDLVRVNRPSRWDASFGHAIKRQPRLALGLDPATRVRTNRGQWHGQAADLKGGVAAEVTDAARASQLRVETVTEL